jgi:hypothetical protein
MREMWQHRRQDAGEEEGLARLIQLRSGIPRGALSETF